MTHLALASRGEFIPRPRRPAVLGLVAALHVLAFAAMFSLGATPETVHETAALMVSVVAVRSESKPAPQPAVRPVLRDIAQVLPPLPVVDVAAAPAAAPAQGFDPPASADALVHPIAEAPPERIDPPRFDADYLDNPAPAYPPLSKRLHETGRVMLSVYVEANGLPTRIELQSSSRHERLDQAAMEAVKRWKFVPAKRGEHAVAAWVLVPIHFSLKG